MQVCNQGMLPVSLRKLFPRAAMIGAEDYVLLDCTRDSRRVNRGDAFVAVSRRNADGHDFIVDAISRGAGVIVAERVPEDIPSVGPHGQFVPVCIVENSAQAYAKICQALFRQPGDRLQLVGVTGTSGKTSSSCLIAGALGAAGHGVGLIGSLGYFDGMDAAHKVMGTPAPKRLSSWLARMCENDCSHAVIEVSSEALSQDFVGGLEFKTVCLTNVREDHLDYHGTVEAYREAKMRIFERMAPDGFAVLNADDEISAEVANWLDIPTLTFGIENPAEVSATIIEQYVSEQIVLITAGGQTLPLRTRMIGRHHVYNCLAAATVGLGMGVDLATVLRGIESVDVVPGRLERLECGQPFGVFVDQASTPDALYHTLDALMEVVEGRILCVFGAEGDGNTAKRARMGEIIEKFADVVILTDNNPRNEAPAKIVSEILSGFCRPGDVQVCHARDKAIRDTLAQAKAGDCVLIAGKGNEKFQWVGEEMVKHEDRDVARKWLYQNARKVKVR